MRSRSRGSARRWWALVSRLSAFVLAVFVWQTTGAYLSPCGASDGCAEPCEGESDQEDCPCPLDCARGCCAATVPGVMVHGVPDVAVPTSAQAPRPEVDRPPPAVDPPGLLRVPKPA